MAPSLKTSKQTNKQTHKAALIAFEDGGHGGELRLRQITLEHEVIKNM